MFYWRSKNISQNNDKKGNTLEMRISTLENDLKQLSQQFETEQLNKQKIKAKYSY